MFYKGYNELLTLEITMSQSYYSFYGSPLHLILEDDLADGYNRAAKAFMDAQVAHKERTGTQWNPDEPLWILTNDEDQAAFAAVGRIITLLVEVNGGGLEIPEEVCTSDFLVKL